jgi:hypothetical protein
MHEPAIDIAPAVARRIGPGNARLARRPAHPTYLCPGCGCRGSHTEPASLVILAADGLPDVARYAHPACMPSSVRPAGPRSFRLPDHAAATGTAALLPVPARDGFRPALIIDLVHRPSARTPR